MGAERLGGIWPALTDAAADWNLVGFCSGCRLPSEPPSAGRGSPPPRWLQGQTSTPLLRPLCSLTHFVFLSSQISPMAKILAATSFGSFSCRKRHSCFVQTLFLLFPAMLKNAVKKYLPLKKKSKVRIGPNFPPGRRPRALPGTLSALIFPLGLGQCLLPEAWRTHPGLTLWP